MSQLYYKISVTRRKLKIHIDIKIQKLFSLINDSVRKILEIWCKYTCWVTDKYTAYTIWSKPTSDVDSHIK